MSDILHDFPVFAPASRVFEAVSTPAGLDRWWTITSSGEPRLGTEYALDFGPTYQWRARVSACEPDRLFELELTTAMDDWIGTRVRFDLTETNGTTQVRFAHLGWPDPTEHYRVSSFCWAMYLRLMKRNVEHGEVVPYELRLDV
ncbi:MAG TPA: SRPBCC domain-containing protein [Gemmatimonadaceae bacterium]|jgi:uncharacterized protein YndB with AHSA1/START domain|nr:SRPBCC domain-containing protein [Gemmatimonadaceae bacterium]